MSTRAFDKTILGTDLYGVIARLGRTSDGARLPLTPWAQLTARTPDLAYAEMRSAAWAAVIVTAAMVAFAVGGLLPNWGESPVALNIVALALVGCVAAFGARPFRSLRQFRRHDTTAGYAVNALVHLLVKLDAGADDLPGASIWGAAVEEPEYGVYVVQWRPASGDARLELRTDGENTQAHLTIASRERTDVADIDRAPLGEDSAAGMTP